MLRQVSKTDMGGLVDSSGHKPMGALLECFLPRGSDSATRWVLARPVNNVPPPVPPRRVPAVVWVPAEPPAPPPRFVSGCR